MTEEIFRGTSIVEGDQLIIVYNSLTEMYGLFLRPGTGPCKGCCKEILVFEAATIGEMVDALDRHIIKEAMRRTREAEE